MCRKKNIIRLRILLVETHFGLKFKGSLLLEKNKLVEFEVKALHLKAGRQAASGEQLKKNQLLFRSKVEEIRRYFSLFIFLISFPG